jgi:hypothetical protein
MVGKIQGWQGKAAVAYYLDFTACGVVCDYVAAIALRVYPTFRILKTVS